MVGLIADAHVHIYSLFNLNKILHATRVNLSRFSQNSDEQLGIFLTERNDCDYFPRIKTSVSSDLSLETCTGVHRLTFRDQSRLWIFQGYQINTAEKIELLALASNIRIPDGLSLKETITEITSSGGVAAACWAFGKWCGKRASILKAYLERDNENELLLADSALRFYPSAILRNAKGPILAGTDPLPMRGEESRAGRFALRYTSGFDTTAPLQSARELLRRSTPQIVGKRLGAAAALKRALQMNFGSGKKFRDSCVT